MNIQKEEVKTKKEKGIFDYPEPSEDFNNTIVETRIDPHSATIKADRPGETEYFRIFDRSGEGDVSKVRKGLLISLPVKHIATNFACFGPEDFYLKIKSDIGKATTCRFAYYETGGGRNGVWAVKEPIKNKQGNVNPYNQTANQILGLGLTRWIRVICNMALGYYEGFAADAAKVELYIQAEKPKFALDYQEVIQKAYKGFILTPENYDSDPHISDFLGKKITLDVVDDKGKKINN